MWGARARDWAEVGEPTTKPLFLAVLDALKVASGTRYLDVGCGAGLAGVLAHERGAIVTGIDASEALIAIARERLPQADLRAGEMESLPYADGSFDAVTGFNSFQFAADRVRALVEARRVTKKGGLLGFGVWGLPEQCQAMGVMAAFRPFLPPPPAGAKENVPLAKPGVLDDLLRSAGWEPTASGEVDCPFVHRDLAMAMRVFMSAGGLSLKITALESEVAAALEKALAPFRTNDGGYRLENRFIYRVCANGA